ncbi:MAG: glutamate--tRNA ligase [Deltaproteobacteria bacterium]|nr:MAG: glutamate--tRNA ligase [Deltaproteobacteria bacterium]
MASERRDAGPARVRIAPSPTGDPHVGTAYIALFNYVFARKTGGQFVLRIEDTDRARSRADSERKILSALRWLGLTWDEGPDVGGPHGPYRQSERGPIYRDHAEQLIAAGKAYRCFCTPERLEQLRAEQRAAKAAFGYDRRCRGIDTGESRRRAEAGEPYTVRLAVPRDGTTTWHDRLRGPLSFDNAQVDDQILLKSDGMPTYHLANVVDDHAMGITHVIRAEEWISSTPKHVLLYDAFGWPQPVWVHMSLLRNPDKSKISKRKNPVSIDYYRDVGILPDALRNFLGIMGFSFGGDREVFSLDEMIDVFSWDKVSVGGPVFDLDKLRWMNEQYIHQLSHEQLADALIDWRLGRDYLLRLMPLFRERIKRFDEFIPAAWYFFAGEIDYAPVAEKLTIPGIKPAQLRKLLLELVDRYDALEAFRAAELEVATRAFADDKQIKTKHLFMLLRLVVTGRTASPPLFDTMEALGKEITRARLRTAAAWIAGR